MSDNTRVQAKNINKVVSRRKNLFDIEKNIEFEKKVVTEQKIEETKEKEQKTKVPNLKLNFEGKLNSKVSDCLEIDTRKEIDTRQRNHDKKKELSCSTNLIEIDYKIFDNRNKSSGNVFNELKQNRSLIIENHNAQDPHDLLNNDNKRDKVKNLRLLREAENKGPSIYDRSKPSRIFAPKSSSPIITFQSTPVDSENFVAYDKSQNKISITRTKKHNSFISQQFSNSQNLEAPASPRKEFFTKEVRKKSNHKRNVVSPIKHEDFDVIEEHDLLCEISSFSDEKQKLEAKHRQAKKDIGRSNQSQIQNEELDNQKILEINNAILESYQKNYLKKQLLKKKKNMKKMLDDYEKYKNYYKNYSKYVKHMTSEKSMESSDTDSDEFLEETEKSVSLKMQKFCNKRKNESRKDKIDNQEFTKTVSSSQSNIEYNDTCVKKPLQKK